MKKKNFTIWVIGVSLVIFLSPLLTGMEKVEKAKILKTGPEWGTPSPLSYIYAKLY